MLHIFDEFTRNLAARWLPSVDTKTIGNPIRACLVDCHLGPLDIVADAASALTPNSFRANAAFLQKDTKTAPQVEEATTRTVERYHEKMHCAYRIIYENSPFLNRQFTHQAAVKSVNNSVGPDDLIPALPEQSAMPRLDLSTDHPAPHYV